MKVLLVNRTCWMGGVETLMFAWASAYKSLGHECEVFFFERGPMDRYLPEDCKIHFGNIADLVNLVRNERFEVVHANSTDWNLGVSVVRNVGAKLVATAHGWLVSGWTSSNCDALVGCSKWLAEAQQPLTDLPMKVVLNGVDVERFKPSIDAPEVGSSAPIVAWVGRGIAVDQKRLDKFAAIAPALRQSGVRLQLVESYGADEVEKVLPEAVRVLRPIVEFWGAKHRDEMPGFFQEVAASGGCLVSTSSYEGLPMTLLEAQACGCPVIGADVIGVNECVDAAYGGTLYPFQIEPEQLATLVIGMLEDKGRMRWRSQACVRYVREHFSLERMAQEYLDIYDEAPYPPLRNIAGIRARLKMSPLFNWEGYVASRWRTGVNLYEASQKMAERGEWSAAAFFARATLTMCPTLYVKHDRLLHLLNTQVRQNSPNAST